ncbi:hypothetical protein HCA55_17355 [Listeria booriae]|uniref:Uncharacterized protein n=2 Tax=Listeria booriae TaxID=1552123 RepID=A0A842B871_9LIST|nr:hypothetical protein [Listeria booriae]MBC1798509.1 hypothetical protein [Listeria booriae]
MNIMGCDIHVMVEKKSKGNLGWDTYLRKNEGFHYQVGRCYELFAILADVRNDFDIVAIDDPRGIPEDASATYLEYVEEWNPECHSHSFITLAELQKYDWSGHPECDYFVNDQIPELEQLAEKHGCTADDIRIVFFFDH